MTRRFDDPKAAFAAAGLHLFERGWLSANGILFPGDGNEEAILVDSGYATHQAQTVALVRRVLGQRQLRRTLNTHLHSDHCGGNAALQAAYGCEIWVPEGDYEAARTWDRARLTYDATGQQCPPFSVHGVLRAGESIHLGGRPWEVIGSPGHDPESVVLYQRDLRILLSADALWENGFGVVFPELEGFGAFDAVGSTLEQLATLSIDWVIPGHGPAFSDVRESLDRARRRLESFRAAPAVHATHAAKVLIKFHLLEMQCESLGSLRSWVASVPYLDVVHRNYFSARPFSEWIDETLAALVRSGAARIDGDYIRDAR